MRIKLLVNALPSLPKLKAPNPLKSRHVETPRDRFSRKFANWSLSIIAGGMILLYGLNQLVWTKHQEIEAERLAQAELSHLSKQDLNCLGGAMFWEGERGDIEDQIAIGQNILERVASGRYANTICGVVNEVRKNAATGKNTAMYSFIFDGRDDPNAISAREKKQWAITKQLAASLLRDWKAYGYDFHYYREVRALVAKSVNYHADYVRPDWSVEDVKDCKLKPLGKIARHFHYADFRKADPEGYAQCIAGLKRNAILRVAKR